MIIEQNIDVLREQGFSQEEIERLSTLRRTLREEQVGREARIQRRLNFVRWLVRTGRLTEQFV